MSLKLLACVLILMAALGSAIWNIHVKKSDNKLTFVTLMVIPQFLIAAPLMLMAPLPSILSLKYIFASAVMQTGYIIFLSIAYTHGMISRVYPLAVGTAPLFSLAFSYIFLGKTLSGYHYWGVWILSLAIMGFMFIDRHPVQGINIRAVCYAFITSLFICAYSLIDTMGIHTVEHPMTYISWLFSIKALIIFLPMLLLQQLSYNQIATDKKNYIIAGLFAGFGYGVAIWAFLYEPTAVVLALRSTALLFVCLLSFFILKEGLSIRKIILTLLVFVGATLVCMG